MSCLPVVQMSRNILPKYLDISEQTMRSVLFLVHFVPQEVAAEINDDGVAVHINQTGGIQKRSDGVAGFDRAFERS